MGSEQTFAFHGPYLADIKYSTPDFTLISGEPSFIIIILDKIQLTTMKNT